VLHAPWHMTLNKLGQLKNSQLLCIEPISKIHFYCNNESDFWDRF